MQKGLPLSSPGRREGRTAMSEPLTLPTIPKPKVKENVKRQPPYNVVLLNDDDHTYEYVITMLQQLFGYPREKGYQMAREVDTTGRVIVLTTTKEHAELKQDQIHAFGPDPLSSRECKGSMSAIIEPAMD
jgi:ATP-dependent Clp protease adaptor protein ClpS